MSEIGKPPDLSLENEAAIYFLRRLRADNGSGRARSLAEYLLSSPVESWTTIAREYFLAELLIPSEPEQWDGGLLLGRQLRYGDDFEGFQLGSQLGCGAQGYVFKAWDHDEETWVALKIIRRDLYSVARRNEHDETLRRIRGLPGICHPRPAVSSQNVAYEVMDFIDGKTLKFLLADREKSTKPLNEAVSAEYLRWIEVTATTLATAHERGVIHRDIKPSNIMISQAGDPVVLDFGLARPTEEEHLLATATGDVVGTPAYMSPEQRSDPSRADHRADIWSLSVVLFELLTSELPSTQLISQGATTRRILRALRKYDGLSPPVARLFGRAWSTDIEDRFQSCVEFAQAVRACRDGTSSIATPPSRRWQRVRNWIGRR